LPEKQEKNISQTKPEDNFILIRGKLLKISDAVLTRLDTLAMRRNVSVTSFINITLFDRIQNSDLAFPETPKHHVNHAALPEKNQQ